MSDVPLRSERLIEARSAGYSLGILDVDWDSDTAEIILDHVAFFLDMSPRLLKEYIQNRAGGRSVSLPSQCEAHLARGPRCPEVGSAPNPWLPTLCGRHKDAWVYGFGHELLKNDGYLSPLSKHEFLSRFIDSLEKTDVGKETVRELIGSLEERTVGELLEQIWGSK